MSEDQTKEELYEKAQDLDIEGRSSMDKDELAAAVAAAEANTDEPPTVTAAEPQGSAQQEGSEQAGGFQPVENNADTHDDSGGEFLPEPGPEANNQSEIKTVGEEYAEQVERREAANKVVEETQANAEQTPF